MKTSNITNITVTLSNGVKMPKFGLGTYKMTINDIRTAVPAAIKAGYKLIDTATVYNNEEAIGEAMSSLIAGKIVDRKDVFLESKLAPHDQGFDSTLKAVDTSLSKLRTDYVDLYIIHWPGGGGLEPSDPKNGQLRKDSWRALEKLYEEGKCRAIGVSNYTDSHLEEMKSYAKLLPMINQVELHPAFVPEATIKWCRENQVIVQAYSSLARGKLLSQDALAHHPILSKTARSHDKTVSQILLRWAWQHDYCIIPKSVSPDRIAENANIDFTLTAEDMKGMDEIFKKEPLRTCWDPTKIA